jgi:hypothetical protein
MARLQNRFLFEAKTTRDVCSSPGCVKLSEPRVLKSLGLVREASMPIKHRSEAH